MDTRINTSYKVIQGKLALCKLWENLPDNWEELWSNQPVEKILNSATNGYLGEYEIFSRYLPKELPVLEAGCGMGQIVMALAARNYKVEGIDYAVQTVHRVNEIRPHLNIHVGDVYHLECADGTYGGYISLGVLEHNPEGPLDGLKEARRVLNKDGFAFISVPFLNSKRKKLLQQLRLTENITYPEQLKFYQYYFSKEEFVLYLNEVGFDIIEVFPISIYWGLIYDYAIICKLYSFGFFYWRMNHFIKQFLQSAPLWMRWHWAHMLMFVCKPSNIFST